MNGDIFTCRTCKRRFEIVNEAMSCTVNHVDGSCCHFNHREITTSEPSDADLSRLYLTPPTHERFALGCAIFGARTWSALGPYFRSLEGDQSRAAQPLPYAPFNPPADLVELVGTP